jgi:hypothetical protein
MNTRLLSAVAYLSEPTALSDDALLTRVKDLAACERKTTVRLIVHLAELDKRRLHLREGHSSLFMYCTRVLHLSEYAAYARIEAARTARRFPIVLSLLHEGDVTLTTVGLLAPHLTDANHQELLQAARHRSKRQVQELVAGLHPQPDVLPAIRRVPPAPAHACIDLHGAPESGSVAGVPARTDDAALTVQRAASPSAASPESGFAAHPGSAGAARPAASVTPLAPERYTIRFTASAQTHDKLRQAQALLRHQIPDGDISAVFDRALTALLAQLLRQKAAATNRPRTQHASGPTVDAAGDPKPGQLTPQSVSSARAADKDEDDRPTSRHIPAEVRRVVWQRDGGQCVFIGRGGVRCEERGFLEFHHLTPYAAGGKATVENIELRCRAHNGYEVERAFGSRRTSSMATSLVRELDPAGDWTGSALGAAVREPRPARWLRHSEPVTDPQNPCPTPGWQVKQ